jgi:hypothetical protein
VVFNALSGTGNTRSAVALELVPLVVYVVFIYLIGIRLHQPVHICFIAEWIYYISLFVGCILYFRFAPWDKKRI